MTAVGKAALAERPGGGDDTAIEKPLLRPVVKKMAGNSALSDVKEKRAAQSRHARESLFLSGRKSGMMPGVLIKGPGGQPLPADGVYWSVSHKPPYAAGVVSRSPAGIDVEKIKRIGLRLYKRVVRPEERELFDSTESLERRFFRVFTAKEAVLKAAGAGLKALGRVTVAEVTDGHDLVLRHRGVIYRTESVFFDGYIASVIKNDGNVKWDIG